MIVLGNIDELKNKLIDWGAYVVGFAKVEGMLHNSLEELKYAVAIGVPLSDFIINQITDKPTYTYFHHYRSVNTLIDQITLRGQLWIQEKGYYSMAVPASQTVNDMEDKYSGVFPHKTAAVLAGLGWIGKNGLFISKVYGPRIRLGTILTNMKLCSENKPSDQECGNCRACVENCPAMALTGNSWTQGAKRSDIVDAKACSDYMNHNFKHIGRGSVCGICIRVCPKAKGIK